MADMRNRYGYSYVGNAAVKAVPKEDPRQIKREKKEHLDNARLKVEERFKEKRSTYSILSIPQFIAISLSVVLLTVFLAGYILTVSNHHSLKRNIAKMQVSYETLVKSNALLENEIENAIDYQTVYAYATKVLKMQIPEKNQIVYYDVDSEEYVSVDGVIPNE